MEINHRIGVYDRAVLPRMANRESGSGDGGPAVADAPREAGTCLCGDRLVPARVVHRPVHRGTRGGEDVALDRFICYSLTPASGADGGAERVLRCPLQYRQQRTGGSGFPAAHSASWQSHPRLACACDVVDSAGKSHGARLGGKSDRHPAGAAQGADHVLGIRARGGADYDSHDPHRRAVAALETRLFAGNSRVTVSVRMLGILLAATLGCLLGALV